MPSHEATYSATLSDLNHVGDRTLPGAHVERPYPLRTQEYLPDQAKLITENQKGYITGEDMLQPNMMAISQPARTQDLPKMNHKPLFTGFEHTCLKKYHFLSPTQPVPSWYFYVVLMEESVYYTRNSPLGKTLLCMLCQHAETAPAEGFAFNKIVLSLQEEVLVRYDVFDMASYEGGHDAIKNRKMYKKL
ncbi:uncharacterized protein N7483_002479 [Penicillium malachiteum]|uniref:uncharacterized protein n=1 Tax=Penicillium malachiteum TaxID=1324776 RepID=UPI002546B346|nr:uncharacterized protein N7483_002479 [Penicillium malachiteum]KAJ5737354.1 hypothetical protein N7483_002479 [Penicillium malachiteum]